MSEGGKIGEKCFAAQRTRLFESLEDASLLAMVDNYRSQISRNPFEIVSRKFNAEIINEKVIIDTIIDVYPKAVAVQSVAILDALVYKMSAPYRHAKFWRSTRRVLKELKKLNDTKFIKYLKNISKDMLKSEMRYGLNIHSKRYIAAVMICQAIRNYRLRTLCEQAALHCLQHIQTGHLLGSNLLLLALNADIHDSLRKNIEGIVKCYDCLLPLLKESRLLNVKELLKTTEDTFKNSNFVISTVDFLRPVMEICGIEESKYADLVASVGTSDSRKRHKKEPATFRPGKDRKNFVERNEISIENSNLCSSSSLTRKKKVKVVQKQEVGVSYERNVPCKRASRENSGFELSNVAESQHTSILSHERTQHVKTKKKKKDKQSGILKVKKTKRKM